MFKTIFLILVKTLKKGQINPTLRFQDETSVENRDHLIFRGIQNTNG
jgi:hypothetical protein